MIPKECKRLAEVDLPIAVVSKHSAREKSIRHGHPSTPHLWWARRPLAACRARRTAGSFGSALILICRQRQRFRGGPGIIPGQVSSSTSAAHTMVANRAPAAAGTATGKSSQTKGQVMRTAPAVALLAAMVSLALPCPAQELRRWLDPDIGRLSPRVEYSAAGFCQQGIEDSDSELCMMKHRLAARWPLFQSDQEEWAVAAGVGAWDVRSDAVLPDTGEEFPEHLWDIHVGLLHRRRLGGGWIFGAAASVGSPSDKPFASADEVSVRVSAFLRVPAGERDAWLLFANFANDREFANCVPLPGFGYWHNPSDALELFVGVPMLSARWRPIPKLELSGRYMLVRTVHAEISYRIAPQVKAYAAFAWDSERFFRHDRSTSSDRLFYYEKRLSGGVVVEIGPRTHIDVSVGYAFDRFFFEGEDYGDRSDNRIDVGDGPFARVRFVMWF
jgi:hypothetical protein